MIIWNFDTPITFIASCIWNASEYFGVGLGRFAPYIFGLVINRRPKKQKENEDENFTKMYARNQRK